MENNFTNILNKIKQPEPSVKDENKKKKFNFPRIGVLSTPTISNTPVFDEYIEQTSANPQIKYNIQPRKYAFFDFQNFISCSIVALGLVSLVKLVRQFLKK